MPQEDSTPQQSPTIEFVITNRKNGLLPPGRHRVHIDEVREKAGQATLIMARVL